MLGGSNSKAQLGWCKRVFSTPKFKFSLARLDFIGHTNNNYIEISYYFMFFKLFIYCYLCNSHGFTYLKLYYKNMLLMALKLC